MKATALVPNLLRLTLALMLALAAVPLGARAASAAEDGYRYWGYFQGTGDTWSFAQKGAAETVPADGSVEGWRYALAGPNDSKLPRAKGNFGAICAKAQPAEGLKRVAVVVDQGTGADAPEGATPAGEVSGTCVIADQQATGADLLGMLADVRIENGMTCGINGYPAAGCGAEKVVIDEPAPADEPVELAVKEPSGQVGGFGEPPAPTTAPSNDSNSPWIIGGVLVAFLVIAGLLLARRRGRVEHPDEVRAGEPDAADDTERADTIERSGDTER